MPARYGDRDYKTRPKDRELTAEELGDLWTAWQGNHDVLKSAEMINIDVDRAFTLIRRAVSENPEVLTDPERRLDWSIVFATIAAQAMTRAKETVSELTGKYAVATAVFADKQSKTYADSYKQSKGIGTQETDPAKIQAEIDELKRKGDAIGGGPEDTGTPEAPAID